MDKKEEYIKSMEFCQTIIERMANNSFRLKQWFILAVIAIVTASSRFIFFTNLKDLNNLFHIDYLFILLPLFIFPYLDAYYLQQERLFRDIYNDFMNCINKKEIIRQPFDMKPTKKQREQSSIWNVIFSVSIAPLYFTIICVLQGLIIYNVSVRYFWLWMSILPIILIVLGFIFKKKTSHRK